MYNYLPVLKFSTMTQMVSMNWAATAKLQIIMERNNEASTRSLQCGAWCSLANMQTMFISTHREDALIIVQPTALNTGD